MEKFVGIETSTIYTMRQDLVRSLVGIESENRMFPKDGCLYKRVEHIAQDILDLTKELGFRNDEIIEN